MLRKISRVLYLVGAILSLVYSLTYFVGGIVFIVLGCLPQMKDALIEALQNGQMTTTFTGSLTEQAAAIQLVYIIVGVIFVLSVAILIVNAVLGFIGRAKDAKAISIMNIVVGVLAGVNFNVAGGILSLISKSLEKKNEE